MLGHYDVTYFDDALFGTTPYALVMADDTTAGTTLARELRRLSGTTLDEQGAANAWAGTNGLSLVGALNSMNGTVAGTTGLGINSAGKAIP